MIAERALSFADRMSKRPDLGLFGFHAKAAIKEDKPQTYIGEFYNQFVDNSALIIKAFGKEDVKEMLQLFLDIRINSYKFPENIVVTVEDREEQFQWDFHMKDGVYTVDCLLRNRILGDEVASDRTRFIIEKLLQTTLKF